jgi:hypothetical protein
MSIRRRALFLAGLFAAVSCSDAGNPLEPGPKPNPGPVDALQVLQCNVSILTGTMRCAPPQANAGGALASGQMITGGQEKYVTLTASNFAPTANSLEFDVTVQSLMRQPLGTIDGVTPHVDGVRVWFAEDPVAQPTGTVTVDMESGTDILLVNPLPYFQYNTILHTGETSAPKRWRFDFAGGATNIAFKVYVVAQVQYENGWVEVTPPLDTLVPGETLDLNGIAYDARADSAPAVSQTLTWSSNAPAVATVDAGTGLVSAVAAGTATITATNGTQSGTATIVVNTQPAFVVDTFPAITNVTIPEPAPGLLKDATDGDGQTVTVVPDTVTTSQGGTAWLNADGSLEYLSKAGFSGEDIIPFEITDGVTRRPAHAVVQVAPSNYWYVRSGGTGDGRDRFPLGTLAQAQDSAAAGDSILVLDNGVLTVSGPVTLEANQAIIGQGIPTAIVRTVNEQAVTILAAGTQPELASATGSTVTLGTDNVIKGVAIASTAGAAGISGTSFGTLRLWYSNVGTAGPALVLSGGALDADSTVTISSTGSASHGISLANVTGSMTTTGGAISGAAAAAFSVAGGSVSVNYGGNVTQGNSAALVAVTGGHNGSLTFPGTLSATAGTGLQFNDADGSYSFPGTATLNGGDGGVDITNGSGGTFVFGTGTGITSPSGTAFAVNGSSPTVTYNGNVTQANNALLVDVSEQPGGTITFQNGTLSATAGTGIQFSNADGINSFTGTVTLNGGDAGIDLVSGTGGSIEFAAGTSITNPSGPAFFATGSTPAGFTFAGTISVNASRPVHIDGGCGPIFGFTGSITSTGQGVLVQNCASGFVSVNGTKTLTTGANQAVTLTSNSGATISFGGGNLGITTTSGTGFGATGGGTVQVTGNNNTISTGTGTGLSLNGVSTGASGVVFRSVSTGAAANGIALNNLTGVGVTVSGDGSTAGSGGTISGTSGHGVSLTNLSALNTGVSLNYLNVSAGAGGNAAFFGSNFGPVGVSGVSLSATGGPALNLSNGTFGGTLTTVSSSGSASTGVSLTNVQGTMSIAGGTIVGGAAGAAVSVSGGGVYGTIASAISQANASRAAVEILSGHTIGVLTFSGPVSATGGTGLQFTDADGTYTFTGTTNLAGGDAGIDIGAPSTGTVNVTPAGGNTAAITSPSGIAIAITGGSADLNYSGNVTQANAQSLLSVSGGHTGDVTFPSGTLSATNGNGLQFDNADGTYGFSGTVTLNNAAPANDAGIDVTNGSAGTFTFPATASITNPGVGNLISILNSAPNFTYAGAFSKANNNVTGILVSNNTGGTINFTGSGVTKSINSGSAAAVNLANNTGTTINFGGGSLAITSGSGAGLTATGGGTLNVTGASNTITSGTGTALNVQNTTIGASGLSFVSISANGGTNGILLSNTGNTNGLQVTGTGSAGTGGTIQNTQTGASFASARNINLSWMNFTNANTSDGAGTCDGLDNSGCTGVVKLTSVTGVALDRLAFSGTISQEGIVGSTVNGITISNMSISNAGNEQWEHGIKLFDVLGTANSITATTVTNAGNFNIFVQNSTSTNGVAGASDSLRIAANTISNPGSALQSDGITVATRSTGNLKVVVDANTFNTVRAATDGVQVDAGGSSKAVAVVTGNSIVGYNTAVNISGASNATNLFTVQNNPTLSSVTGATVNLASNGLSILRGTVKGNTNMTTASTNNSTTGIDAIVDAGGVLVADIDGNTITGKYLAGIRAGARNAANPGDADFTIRNNSITAQTGTTTPFAGLYMVAGNGSPGETNRTCMNLSNNQIVSQAPGAFDYDIYLESYNGGGYNNTFQIQGLTGSGSNATNVHNYVSSKDIGGARVQGFFTTGAETYTAATCATP